MVFSPKAVRVPRVPTRNSSVLLPLRAQPLNTYLGKLRTRSSSFRLPAPEWTRLEKFRDAYETRKTVRFLRTPRRSNSVGRGRRKNSRNKFLGARAIYAKRVCARDDRSTRAACASSPRRVISSAAASFAGTRKTVKKKNKKKRREEKKREKKDSIATSVQKRRAWPPPVWFHPPELLAFPAICSTVAPTRFPP